MKAGYNSLEQGLVVEWFRDFGPKAPEGNLFHLHDCSFLATRFLLFLIPQGIPKPPKSSGVQLLTLSTLTFHMRVRAGLFFYAGVIISITFYLSYQTEDISAALLTDISRTETTKSSHIPETKIASPLLIPFRAFNIGEFILGKAQQPLPQALQTQEAEINLFANLCRQLCTRLLGLCASGLKVCSCGESCGLKAPLFNENRSMQTMEARIGSPLGMGTRKVPLEAFSDSSM